MRRFLVQIVLYGLPAVICLLLLEWQLRRIPNDYRNKRAFVRQHGDSLEVLVLGSSEALYGINPLYFHRRSFNMAGIAQTLDLDWEILRRNEPHLQHLKMIVLPVSYFSFNMKLVRTTESQLICKYNIYYDFWKGCNPVWYSEVFTNTGHRSLSKLYYYFSHDSSDVHCNGFGWGANYIYEHREDLNKTALRAIKIHNYHNDVDSKELAAAADNIVAFCKRRKIILLLVTPPVSTAYLRVENAQKMAAVRQKIRQMVEACPGASYVNFTGAPAFSDSDFYDSNHLHNLGATKLSQCLDTLIEQTLIRNGL